MAIENRKNDLPFDIKDIEISLIQITTYQLIDRVRCGEIQVKSNYHKSTKEWGIEKKSKLIESLLLGLPLPAFYMDVSDYDNWVVIDGFQRLSALKQFVVDREFKLTNLEYLKNIEGKAYYELDRVFMRRLDESIISVNQIKKATPRKAVEILFHRLH